MTSHTYGHAPGMVNATEAAHILGCEPTTVRCMARDGRLAVKDRTGKAMLFYRCDVEKLVGTLRHYSEDVDRCALCAAPLDDTAVEWGPLRARLCRRCPGILEQRIQDVQDARYCPVCGGTKIASSFDDVFACVCAWDAT